MKMKKSSSRRKSAPSPKFEDDDFMDDDMCSTDGSNAPVPRNTANARERARMRVLSGAFYRLKTIIPWVPHDTKLSKLDTLRLAKNYISYLTATLEGQPVDEITNKLPQPQKMTWPYIFQQVPELGKKKSSPSQKKEQNPTITNYSNCYSSNLNKPLYEPSIFVPSVSNRNSFTHQLASNDSLVLLYN